MSNSIILLDPVRFSCLQNKRVPAFNLLNNHKRHVMNLMTFHAEMHSHWFWCWLDEGPGRCFMLPPSYFCLPFCKAHILAFQPTGSSWTSTLLAGHCINAMVRVTVYWGLNLPGLLSVERCASVGIASVRASLASAIHTTFEALFDR